MCIELRLWPAGLTLFIVKDPMGVFWLKPLAHDQHHDNHQILPFH